MLHDVSYARCRLPVAVPVSLGIASGASWRKVGLLFLALLFVSLPATAPAQSSSHAIKQFPLDRITELYCRVSLYSPHGRGRLCAAPAGARVGQICRCLPFSRRGTVVRMLKRYSR